MTTGRTWDALWRGCALLKWLMYKEMGRMGRTLDGNLLLAFAISYESFARNCALASFLLWLNGLVARTSDSDAPCPAASLRAMPTTALSRLLRVSLDGQCGRTATK